MAGTTLNDCFQNSFQACKEKEALSFFRDGALETTLSYRSLNLDSNRMANTFIDLGVNKGDRVILYLEKSLAYIIAYLALQKIGAIAVPLNPGFKESEMSYFLNDTQAKLVLTDAETESVIRAVDYQAKTISIPTERPYQELDFFRTGTDTAPRVGLQPKDPGLIIYTSGTTGKPKGTILTHRNLVHDAKNVITIWEIAESDVLCHALPFFHVHGLCFALHTALISGAHVKLLDRFSPQSVIHILSQKDADFICTLFMAVPSMYSRLMDYIGENRFDFEHMRLWTSGSAPLLAQDFERIKQIFGQAPVEREGMTETGMNFSNPLKGKRKSGSIGLTLPNLEVRIVDPENITDVIPGQIGEFWLKGPAVTPGYWRKPQETASAFDDGWFRTGDLGRVDEDGYYYLTDRLKHIIISGGENISPKEIEGIINRHAAVRESSVVGVPDDKWGEKVVAAVAVKSESRLNAAKIQDLCKAHLHNWKCPKEVILVNELPKNSMGKILKEEVKKFFLTKGGK